MLACSRLNLCVGALEAGRYLGGAQVDEGGGAARGHGGLVGAVCLVEDAPQQGDRGHDGVQDGQDAGPRLRKVLLVHVDLQLRRGHTHTHHRYHRHTHKHT